MDLEYRNHLQPDLHFQRSLKIHFYHLSQFFFLLFLLDKIRGELSILFFEFWNNILFHNLSIFFSEIRFLNWSKFHFICFFLIFLFYFFVFIIKMEMPTVKDLKNSQKKRGLRRYHNLRKAELLSLLRPIPAPRRPIPAPRLKDFSKIPIPAPRLKKDFSGPSQVKK